ncbi:MAG: hypothetical protein MUF28_03000 [Ignavibacterium sp.]|jgi:hypothetical protein|nr:hypothetical protein [Ignavibacterium sp.]
MIRKFNIILYLLIAAVSINAQQTVKEGKVNYTSSELVYVDFENTDGISIGDTLFNKIKNKYNPALKVKYLSKSSLSGENLTARNIDAGTSIFAFVIIQDSSSNSDIQNDLQTVVNTAVIVEPPVNPATDFEKKESSLSKTTGRYSLQSYSNFSNNGNSIDYQRWRHSFKFSSQRIGESGFSFSTYAIFAYKADEWNAVSDNLNKALKVYDLNIKYEFDEDAKIVAGRFLNSKISNISTIDGAMVEKSFSSWSFGLVAGSRPDFNDFSFNPKLFEYGGYISKSDKIGTGIMENTISAFNQTNDFKTDRRFLYFQHTNSLIKNIFLFGSAEVDLFKIADSLAQNDFSLTGLFFSARYSPAREFSLNVSYDARRNVIYYETYKSLSQTILENELRQGFRARASFRPITNLFFSLQYGYRNRNGDLKASTNYGANLGYSKIPIIESSANIDFNRINSSYVDGYVYSANLTKSIYSLSSDLSLGFRKTIYNFSNGASQLEENSILFDYSINAFRPFSFSISYEGIFESTHSYGRILFDVTTIF